MSKSQRPWKWTWIMAAVALPNISQYFRTYTIRGGSQAFAGEMQSARSKGIMSNTNAGVSFVVVDRDSYRWVMEDLPTLAEQLGPLHDLPTGVEFEPTTAANSGPSVISVLVTLADGSLGSGSGVRPRGAWHS